MWHEHLTHLSNSPVRCIHFILRHFSTVLFLHTLYYLVISEKNQLLYCSFAVYLLLFSTSLYLYILLLCLGTLQKERLYREPAILTSCGSSLLWHGLISAEHGYDAISGKKTGSMCLCRMWSLWTLAVLLLPDIPVATSQPVLFRATNANPQLALFRATLFRATNIWRNTASLLSDEKVLHVTCYCGDILRWGGQVSYSFFLTM